MELNHIDGGKVFDWGRTSRDYAKYRDIYPGEFYQYLLDQGLCTSGQRVLDLGTGTGVLPRNLYAYGASFTGVDVSENQVEQAARLAREGGMEIEFFCAPAEEIEFAPETFDAVTACQCFDYFNHPALAPVISRVLKKGGKFAVFYMDWLPGEDQVAAESEKLILRYNPAWSGGGETRHLLPIPEAYLEYFEVESREMFDVRVPFTRQSWNGRMKACRGIGASLPDREIERFEKEHLTLLEQIAPEQFQVLHFVTAAILRKKGGV